MSGAVSVLRSFEIIYHSQAINNNVISTTPIPLPIASPSSFLGLKLNVTQPRSLQKEFACIVGTAPDKNASRWPWL